MKRTALPAPVTCMLERFDFLCAAVWRWQRQRAGGQLERVLHAHGELSFETRRATDRFVQMDFAVTSGAMRLVQYAASYKPLRRVGFRRMPYASPC